MKMVVAREIRGIDQEANERLGISGLVLMENAGLRVLESIELKFGNVVARASRPPILSAGIPAPGAANLRACIVCGKGNNGGDGFVVARHLANRGGQVEVFLAAHKNEVKGDALANLKIAETMGINIREIHRETEVRTLAESLQRTDIVVDALLGTGVAGRLRGVIPRIIREINQSGCSVVSVDLPSGIDSDTGQTLGAAVRASWTVTLALPKRGVLLHPGAEHAGELYVGDIGIPRAMLESDKMRSHVITPELAAGFLPERKSTAHKGDFGRVLIVGGSAGMAGAVILAAKAALRAGCGLCTIALPESVNVAAKAAATEAITVPLPETVEHSIAEHAMYSFEIFTRRVDVMAIGPGLTRNPETANFARRLIEQSRLPAVIDADAIAAWVGKRADLKRIRTTKILTPHPGEMAELMGLRIEQVQRDRIGAAIRCANECGAIVVLKGARTVVASPDGEVHMNLTGNAGMATGGTGDVLTGLIASLLAQGLHPMPATISAVYLHGLAGDIAASHLGQTSLIAGDLVDHLPAAFAMIRELPAKCRVAARLYRLV